MIELLIFLALNFNQPEPSVTSEMKAVVDEFLEDLEIDKKEVYYPFRF
jgi:hypothetical protein